MRADWYCFCDVVASVLTPLVDSLHAAIDTAKGEQLKARRMQKKLRDSRRSRGRQRAGSPPVAVGGGMDAHSSHKDDVPVVEAVSETRGSDSLGTSSTSKDMPMPSMCPQIAASVSQRFLGVAGERQGIDSSSHASSQSPMQHSQHRSTGRSTENCAARDSPNNTETGAAGGQHTDVAMCDDPSETAAADMVTEEADMITEEADMVTEEAGAGFTMAERSPRASQHVPPKECQQDDAKVHHVHVGVFVLFL